MNDIVNGDVDQTKYDKSIEVYFSCLDISVSNVLSDNGATCSWQPIIRQIEEHHDFKANDPCSLLIDRKKSGYKNDDTVQPAGNRSKYASLYRKRDMVTQSLEWSSIWPEHTFWDPCLLVGVVDHR